MGLMQLMPETARELSVDDPFDPSQNLREGITCLRQLLDRYGSDEELALVAYNAGPVSVAQIAISRRPTGVPGASCGAARVQAD